MVGLDDASYKKRNPERFRSLPEDLPYTDRIDPDALARDLSAALARSLPIIVEGICLRDVLAAVGQKPDTTVYIKLLSANAGVWNIQRDVEGSRSRVGAAKGHPRRRGRVSRSGAAIQERRSCACSGRGDRSEMRRAVPASPERPLSFSRLPAQVPW